MASPLHIVPTSESAIGDVPVFDGQNWLPGSVSTATPALAAGSVTSANIVDGTLVNADVNASAAIAESKLNLASDAAAGTASRRTLSTTATSACAGNDARLSDSRAPNGSATGDLGGTYPAPTVAKSSTSTWGVYNVAAVARPAAYTQTYATATRTHSNPTAVSVVTTGAALASYGYTQAQADALVTAINALVVDVANVKGVLNSVVDDLQLQGHLA